VTSPPRAKPEENKNAKKEINMKTVLYASHKRQRRRHNASLTSVRVRFNEIDRSIVVRSSLTIRIKGWRHEGQRGRVQCTHCITAVPISWSFVAQTGLLENLCRLDTMIIEEIAKIGRNRDRIISLRACLASVARGA
jgi:hypothetical protein